MRIIALEEHFILPREEQNLPPGAHRGNDREKLLGFDVIAELLDLGESRLAAMDTAGIDMQVLSHNQPGFQALEDFVAQHSADELGDRALGRVMTYTSATTGRLIAWASTSTRLKPWRGPPAATTTSASM